ncbi:hypothetical protein OO013_08025 [Mangrovivirga sp. M17]|uniref:Lipocalin-like domain-containing protein n=1 Tax=Mangrovivirga halotolerans TaxID=2993936 RepID=A0ABT3RQI6_9BACT|nr:hypothetical protein [Mangrovivirga halotolerans]MCX2743808.1 hypothetical protein [Mangrovivirga halotolerans]
MKKFFSAIAVLTMVFSLVSCGGDDEPQVYGFEGHTWTLTREVVYECPDIAHNKDVEESCTSLNCWNYSFENGNFTYYGVAASEPFNNPGKYNVESGNILVFNFDDGQTMKAKFEMLDANTLKFYGSQRDGFCKEYYEFSKVVN